jgi:S-adenosylmethionine:tRNA ribosyltransferase-isomerase
MTSSVFNYNLPEDRIAQRPVYPYDQAKLLVIDRSTNHLHECVFRDIGKYIKAQDQLIFNNSRVIPARLYGKLQPGGGEVEFLLLNPLERRSNQEEVWSALGRPLKKLRTGSIVNVSDLLTLKVLERVGEKEVALCLSAARGSVTEALTQIGYMPIPPYIRKGRSDQQDRIDYQSPFAKCEGSVAAPTASLHFTESLLADLRTQGVHIDEITLHVGAASFLPVFDADSATPVFTPPGREKMVVSPEFSQSLMATKVRGGRRIAVGTTVVRALESLAAYGELNDILSVDTEIFIQPGHEFKNVDSVVTNFHQPGTSHMLLVEALLGRDLLKKSYEYALNNQFRFLSYGDAMLIL